MKTPRERQIEDALRQRPANPGVYVAIRILVFLPVTCLGLGLVTIGTAIGWWPLYAAGIFLELLAALAMYLVYRRVR